MGPGSQTETCCHPPADVKGYSCLMGEDEESIVLTLNAYKEVMTNLIQRYRGRVVDAPGGNVLAEFASVVDAVRCAVKIQKELKAQNPDLRENRGMEFFISMEPHGQSPWYPH